MKNPFQQDLLDIILDQDNKDPILLIDENGKSYEFEQVAVIPYEQRLYCVLHPITEIKGIADNEAIVFEYRDEDGGKLVVVEDEKTAITIFDKYYDLLKKERTKRRKK